MSDSLAFNPNFPFLLKTESAKKLGKTFSKVSKRFESWDSYAYLLQTASDDKYVGKIYRFPNWPEKGKLEKISIILKKNNIPHEEIVYISHKHPVFKYGWQISRFIPGGTARDMRQSGKLSDKKYYVGIGKMLKMNHRIHMSFFGSLHNKQEQYKSFSEFAKEELLDLHFDELPRKYSHTRKIAEIASSRVLELLDSFNNKVSSLVHDDVGERNVMWNSGDPILIDWVDSVAGPPLRDFATITFRSDLSILKWLEQGYGSEINHEELYLHQLMRFLRLIQYYFFEDKDYKEVEIMTKRLKLLLESKNPFGI